jgi:hypothetical protein
MVFLKLELDTPKDNPTKAIQKTQKISRPSIPCSLQEMAKVSTVNYFQTFHD